MAIIEKTISNYPTIPGIARKAKLDTQVIDDTRKSIILYFNLEHTIYGEEIRDGLKSSISPIILTNDTKTTQYGMRILIPFPTQTLTLMLKIIMITHQCLKSLPMIIF